MTKLWIGLVVLFWAGVGLAQPSDPSQFFTTPPCPNGIHWQRPGEEAHCFDLIEIEARIKALEEKVDSLEHPLRGLIPDMPVHCGRNCDGTTYWDGSTCQCFGIVLHTEGESDD
jgi:hypothetical protein